MQQSSNLPQIINYGPEHTAISLCHQKLHSVMRLSRTSTIILRLYTIILKKVEQKFKKIISKNDTHWIFQHIGVKILSKILLLLFTFWSEDVAIIFINLSVWESILLIQFILFIPQIKVPSTFFRVEYKYESIFSYLSTSTSIEASILVERQVKVQVQFLKYK
jgi:hypothetical protein